MVEGIGFILKGVILTEVLTNAARSWEIFKHQREWVKKNGFFSRLLDCFECTSVWAGVFIFCYLTYFEFPVFTWAIIFHRAACFINQAWLHLDWSRANKEQDFMNKMQRR